MEYFFHFSSKNVFFKGLFSVGCLADSVLKNFFIPSVYTKIITAKTFSSNENIVSCEKFSEKMVIFTDIMKFKIMIF